MQLNQLIDRLHNSDARLTFVADNGTTSVRRFADLHDDVQTLTVTLQAAGIGPGARVGILAPNGYQWMLWDLAILHAGAISVAFPQEKSARTADSLLADYQLDLLALDPALCPLPQIPGAIDINREPAQLQDLAPVASADATVDPRIHSLVFSSGTTGKTKGLIISAPGTERLLNLFETAFGVEPGDCLLTFLPFANYQQRMTYYFCLYHGTDFVTVPFPRLFAGLKQFRPTYLIAPPVFYETLQKLAQTPMPGTANLSSAERLAALLGGRIRFLITGMAPIKRQTLDFFWNSDVQLFEAFGITEAGMVAWNKPGSTRVGTVGKPAEPGSVTLSAEGEVIIGRDAPLSLGYFEASAEDSASTFLPGNRVATGDIARFDDDGFLMIIGRKKDAIITKSGEKFHPESIESLIQLDPRVSLAVVLGGDDLPGITAVVALAADTDATQQDIKARISQINSRLPVYQQVKRILFTRQEFSADNGLRTQNLKLNRKAILQAFQTECIESAVPVPQQEFA